MFKYKKINHCRCCGNAVSEYLNLGDQPLANSYHEPSETLQTYPLALCVCDKCYHSQLSVVVDPDEMFKNYAYVSGTTKTLDNYFSWFSDFSLKNKNISNNINVLDIACNDGSQLKHFIKKGCSVWGVDPAENIAPLAKLNGVNIKIGYWDDQIAKNLFDELNKCFDIIIAQNVFAHTHDILSFLNSCKLVMDDKTDLYIQTSQAKMFYENQFDTAYHEHVSFFNTLSMKTIVEKAGLHLNEVYLTDIHGTSYVFKINKVKQENTSVIKQIEDEKQKGLYSLKKYSEFSYSAHEIVRNLKQTVEELKQKNYKIIGYGAAAKGMTVLNFAKINYELIDYIIDENPLKVGKLTPGSNIPIKPLDQLEKENDKLAVIPLAWNFFDEIKTKIESKVKIKDIKYIKYFPQLEIF